MSLDGIGRRGRKTTPAAPAAPQPKARPKAQPRPTTAATPRAAVAQPAASATAVPGHITSYGQLSSSRKTITMIGVILAMLLSAMDQTIVGTALPRIVRDLGGLDHISWVVTAYLLASTVAVPIYGKLSDMFGRKWFFFSAIVIFLIASILCGASHTMWQLILFRGLQGIGGGAIMGNAFAIIGDLFPPTERGKWQGILGGIFGLASVIGPALGGFLTDNASWRWVFYINLPLGLLALAFIASRMPHIKPHQEDKTIDFLGAGLLVTTLVPLLLGLVWGGHQYAWSSPQELALFGIGTVSLLAFLRTEHQARQPILPLDLFKNRIFTVSVVVTFLTAMAMFGAILYIPLFAQLVLGVSATNSGTIITPLMLSLVGSSIISGQAISKTGKYRTLAITGIGILVLGLLWMAQITPATHQWEIIVRMCLIGIGLGTTMPIFNIAIQNAFDTTRIGVVTAASQLFRSIGGTVGTAVLGLVFNSALTQRTADLSHTTFVEQAAQLHLPFTDITAEKVQGMLSPAVQRQVEAILAKLPGAISTPLIGSFHTFIATAKDAFAGAVSQVFLISAIVAGAAFILSFWLQEIPLRRSNKPAAEEAGDELAVELGQAEGRDAPRLASH